MKPFIDTWSIPKADFVLDDLFCDMVSVTSFGSHNTPERAALCGNTVRQVYSGDEGRKKVRGVIMALLTRDGLLVRLGDVKCPVHWLQVCLSLFLPLSSPSHRNLYEWPCLVADVQNAGRKLRHI